MNRKILPAIILIAAALVVLFVFFFYKKGSTLMPLGVNTITKGPSVITKLDSQIISAAKGQKTVEVLVKATDYKYDPIDVKVPLNTRILLTFVNLGQQLHNWTAIGKKLRASTPTIAPGQQITISFITPTSSEAIVTYCSVDDHRGLGERGTLVVQ